MPTLLDIKNQITNLVAFTVESAKDGLSWDELLILQKRFTDSAMSIVAVANLSGEQKKALVLDAVGMMFDALVGRVALLVLPWYLAWIVWLAGPAIRPILRQVFIAAASSLVEQLFVENFKGKTPDSFIVPPGV